ncbi:MAG: hypothetical protein V1750_11085 [Acidobacteriota bacterium]
MRTPTPVMVLTGVVLALFTGVAPLLAGFAGTDVFLPSVGRKPGAAGSQWYTTLWIYNPGAANANVQVTFLERDKDNTVAPIYNLTIVAGETQRFDNAIWSLFNKEAFGALRVSSPDHKLVVNSRI